LTLVIIHDFLIKTTDHRRRRRIRRRRPPPSYHHHNYHHFDHHHHYQQHHRHHLKISYTAFSFIIVKFQKLYNILIEFVINK
jgi:hypothetical protein